MGRIIFGRDKRSSIAREWEAKKRNREGVEAASGKSASQPGEWFTIPIIRFFTVSLFRSFADPLF
jgi:hypothetical protein